MLILVWQFDLFTLSAALRINCQQLRGGRHWRGQDGDDDGDGEGGRFGLLCCSAGLLVLTDNDGMSESQPTLTMMSTIVMRIVHFQRSGKAELFVWWWQWWCFERKASGAKPLECRNCRQRASPPPPLPHCLHNKLAILSFNKNDQQKKAQKVLQVVAQRRSVVFTSFTELRSYKELESAFGSMCTEQLMNCCCL